MTPITLDSLRERCAHLPFRLDYRIKLEDNQIKENHQSSEEITAWLHDASVFYLQAGSADRESVRALFDDDDKRWHLFILFGRLCDSIRQPHDEPHAEKAAIMLSIEDARFDPRDWQMHLRRLVRACTAAQVHLAPVLLKAAALSNTEGQTGTPASTAKAFADLAEALAHSLG